MVQRKQIEIMAQNTLNVTQVSVEGYHEKMFVEFFSIDSDFSENKEYWREDTLKLGYKNESERCSAELWEKLGGAEFFEEDYQHQLGEALEKAANYSFDGTQHILGNGTYTAQYDITTICIDDNNNEYIVVVAWMSN
jgi:hypothetical protein